ncbi:hypothetical protein BX070DRAFT_129195 [Coemansia spiralis]|nr:hypothetical protein BX070DRAFT_129195 [Coemansia spiralis]
MNNEKHGEFAASPERFPELHADIEAGLFNDARPQQQHKHHQEHQHQEHQHAPRKACFRKFVRRALMRVLLFFGFILTVNATLHLLFGRHGWFVSSVHSHHHDYHNHHGHHDHGHPPSYYPHYPPNHPPHPPHPPSYYGPYSPYAPHRPEYGYGYGYNRPYPAYSPYTPRPGYHNAAPYNPYNPYNPGFGHHPYNNHPVRPHVPPSRNAGSHNRNSAIDAAVKGSLGPLVAIKDRPDRTHNRPSRPNNFHHLKEQVKANFRHVDPKSLMGLIQGSLPTFRLGSLLRPIGDVCIPTVPVSDIDPYTFDPTEFDKITHTVIGAIGSDISIVPTSDGKASYVVKAMASSQEIADKVSFVVDTDSEGNIKFKLHGPKLIGREDCIYANIVLKVPQSVANLTALNTNYIYGKFSLDRKVAHDVVFGDFAVNAAVGPLSIPPVHANNARINVISGDIHGFYHITEGASINTVNGKIDVGVNVSKASKSDISAASVSGTVSLRVAGGFDGKFSASTLNGKVVIEDASDGSNRLHFDKDYGRSKSGTFGPENEGQAGESSLKASAVNGNVSVEFD